MMAFSSRCSRSSTNRWQRIAVACNRPLLERCAQWLRPLRARPAYANRRGTGPIGSQRAAMSVRILDDDLPSPIFAEVRKLFQHLFGRPQIQRRRTLGGGKPVPGHNNASENLIFRVDEVRVGRRDDGQSKLFRQGDDAAVNIPQAVFVGHRAVVDQKPVVAYGLNFQIVVKASDLKQPLLGLHLARPLGTAPPPRKRSRR